MAAHVVSPKVYAAVFAALLGLLAISVAAAEIEHGPINLAIGLAVAAAKAVLIVLFFMHLRYDAPLVRLAAAAGLVWVAILMSLTFGDFLTRGSQSEHDGGLKTAAAINSALPDASAIHAGD